MTDVRHVVRLRHDPAGLYVATLWERVPHDGDCATTLHRFVREASAEDPGRAVLLAAGNVTEHDVELG